MVKQGVIGGIIAGLVFAIFEMVMATVLMGTEAFFMPLRMIGAIVLGQQAIAVSYPLITAALTGVVVHMILSVVFGIVFVGIAYTFPIVSRSKTATITATSIYGLLIWIVNFYIIAPVFAWTWFPEQTNPIVQFVAHTFFYGTVLGIYLSSVHTSITEQKREAF